MKITPVCGQKALRVYAIAKASKTGLAKYKAKMSTGGRFLEVPIIKTDNGEYIAVILPANSTNADSRIEILERHTGNTAARIELSHAEFMTKVSRHVPEELSLLNLIDEFDLQNPLHRQQYDLNLEIAWRRSMSIFTNSSSRKAFYAKIE